jgi:hypothetical protein
MKIMNVKSEKLRNEEHFQFQSEFKGLVERFTPATLGIEATFAAYLPLYANEAEALDVIRKSAVTDEIDNADHLRDTTFRGMCDTVKGATNHFTPTKREAAQRIQIAIDHFGNINAKPYDEQTASIKTLLADLITAYAADVATLSLEEWITELQANNDAFEALMDERYSDDAGKTQLKMKEVRREVDTAFRTITTRIDALAVVNGPETYTPFVNELNSRVEKYNNMLARRKGRNAKPDEPLD